MVIIVDNYDSFTYNLAQYVGELGHEVKVLRNDTFTIEDVGAMHPTHLIISPGPGRPEDAGISCAVLREFYRQLPVLGVCLGHQCLAHILDGEVVEADRVMHGKVSQIYHTGGGIFQGVPSPFEATRYNSLIVRDESLPPNIQVTAHTADGEIMGLRTEDYPVEGVQFHPESILTRYGKQILTNFLNSRPK